MLSVEHLQRQGPLVSDLPQETQHPSQRKNSVARIDAVLIPQLFSLGSRRHIVPVEHGDEVTSQMAKPFKAGPASV